ncbi:MAG: OsmC family peroxiredoxin [Alphaproteobacteria bacterium]|nr:OsmC family peroxiredoxin [Alphaproteobacteria bacterium]
MAGEHEFRARTRWTGGWPAGATGIAAFGRDYVVEITGKPPLQGSAAAGFQGDAQRHNPEDLLLAALSACHMLSYLALAARARIRVLAYEDTASATLQVDASSGSGRLTEATLRPDVVIADAALLARAEALHARAHALCFIANSINFPVRHAANVRAEAATA